MNVVWGALILVVVTAVTVSAMLLVRRRAPKSTWYSSFARSIRATSSAWRDVAASMSRAAAAADQGRVDRREFDGHGWEGTEPAPIPRIPGRQAARSSRNRRSRPPRVLLAGQRTSRSMNPVGDSVGAVSHSSHRRPRWSRMSFGA